MDGRKASGDGIRLGPRPSCLQNTTSARAFSLPPILLAHCILSLHSPHERSAILLSRIFAYIPKTVALKQ